MRSFKPREILKLLQDRGFYHINPILRVTVPLHTKDLKIGTLLSILRQAGLSKEQVS